MLVADAHIVVAPVTYTLSQVHAAAKRSVFEHMRQLGANTKNMDPEVSRWPPTCHTAVHVSRRPRVTPPSTCHAVHV